MIGVTGPAEWLLSFLGTRQEFANPGLGNRETRGGWLVREAALQSVTMSLCEDALVSLVAQGLLEPVRYSPVAAPPFAPDPGRGCGASMYPKDEPYGWHARKSPAWAWVYRVPREASALVAVRKAAAELRAMPRPPRNPTRSHSPSSRAKRT